ncbi:cupin domain-containing protein [Streptosporangiaceae bacterium NEAU-GS5]|nr:cupin domain-containing protein [Streptosporangiaceae bacterium NEAU-GS5]
MRFVREAEVRAVPATPGQFTEGVWRADTITEAVGDGLRAQRFSYEPQARSAWHVHDGEQALYVVAGRGVVVRQGAEPVAIGPGDWVHVQPGEKHWHGAAADDTLVHLAVTAGGQTHWHEPVTDEEYRAGTQ